MAVHAAVGNKPEQMQPMSARSGKGILQNRVALQFAIGDGLIDSRQVLINDSARSKIKMANFRVAHLPVGQTDIECRWRSVFDQG